MDGDTLCCTKCKPKRVFASRFSLKRHAKKFHESANKCEMMDDDKETNAVEQCDNKDTSEVAQNLDTFDFWQKLIQEIINDMLEEIESEEIEHVADTSDLLIEPMLSRIISRLRNKFSEYQELVKAAEKDEVMLEINKKLDKLTNTGLTNSLSFDELIEAAWEKYKFIIKSKTPKEITQSK